MPKLKVEYRTKEQDRESCFRDSTYFVFTIKDRTTVISIAANETRNLSDIVYGIEEELQDGYHLQSGEKFEIDEEIKFIMEYEKTENRRMNNELYPYFKFIAQNNPEKLKQSYVNGGTE